MKGKKESWEKQIVFLYIFLQANKEPPSIKEMYYFLSYCKHSEHMMLNPVSYISRMLKTFATKPLNQRYL